MTTLAGPATPSLSPITAVMDVDVALVAVAFRVPIRSSASAVPLPKRFVPLMVSWVPSCPEAG